MIYTRFQKTATHRIQMPQRAKGHQECVLSGWLETDLLFLIDHRR